MRMLNAKKGGMSTGIINTAILAIVLLVVLFQLYASLVPTAQTAGKFCWSKPSGSVHPLLVRCSARWLV